MVFGDDWVEEYIASKAEEIEIVKQDDTVYTLNTGTKLEMPIHNFDYYISYALFD